MKWISSSLCLTFVYEAWSCMLDVWSLLPFSTWRIATTNVVFRNSGWLHLAFLPAHSPKSIASSLCPHHPFFLASLASLAH
jgi:hypothetical protein